MVVPAKMEIRTSNPKNPCPRKGYYVLVLLSDLMNSWNDAPCCCTTLYSIGSEPLARFSYQSSRAQP